MATELKVPALGMDMEEATVLRWLVEEGTEVSKGDPVLEIETDKTSFEVEANGSGEIRSLRGEEGETLPVGTVLAYITAPGEEIPDRRETEKAPQDGNGRGSDSASASQQAPQRATQQVPRTEDREKEEPEPAANGTRRRLRASPAARRAAEERGVSLQEISGSGPGGRIYLSDVLEAEVRTSVESDVGPDGRAPEVAEEPVSAEAASEEAEGLPVAEPVEEASPREKLSRVRRVGAARTAKSFSEVPHFYLTRDLEVERLLELRSRLGEKTDPAPSVTDLLALAVSRKLGDHPRLNASYAADELELHPHVNLGLAVATGDGLVVPVLKKAESLSLRELAPKARELVERARAGKLAPEELSGGTFTISNLGMMGIDSFDAVINAPEAAILAVGRVRTVPEWQGGEWVARRIITATLSVDHRVADGADGARFLEGLQAALTDWELLL